MSREQKFEAAVEYSKAAMRGAFLLNGGATITLFAFFSQSIAHFQKFQPATVYNLSPSLLVFSFGVFFAVICNVFAYLSQSNFKSERNRYAKVLKFFAFIFLFFSLCSFLWGIINAYLFFRSIGF